MKINKNIPNFVTFSINALLLQKYETLQLSLRKQNGFSRNAEFN